MPITLVTPIDRERLVPVTTAIIIDFMATTVASVTVNSVQVHNGASALAGWMALLITRPGGVRLVLDPPTSFGVGDVVLVNALAADESEVSFIFQVGLRQITSTDDASVPRVTETSDDPWVVYSRVPGNIYARKDDPLTSEVLVVPGDEVDIGYNEVEDEIEIMYVQNGKVFLVTGDPSDVPSTLAQPSILKSNFKTGDTGDGVTQVFASVTFPPIKYATPSEFFITGDTGDSNNHRFQSPPNSPIAVPLVSDIAVVVVTPPQSSLINEVVLYKINTGASVVLASFPYSTELQIFFDSAYVAGDRYYTQAKYGDPGASEMKRLAPRSDDLAGAPGDVVLVGATGDNEAQVFSQETFAPLKRAVPPEVLITGDTSHSGDYSSRLSFFPPAGAAAVMSAPLGDFIVVTGLVTMSRQHLGLFLTVSGAANPSNNGDWAIVEIISATSVRIRAPGAAGSASSLTWTVTGPTAISPASFVTRNTLNIGVGA